jgi:hypothetical protein
VACNDYKLSSPGDAEGTLPDDTEGTSDHADGDPSGDDGGADGDGTTSTENPEGGSGTVTMPGDDGLPGDDGSATGHDGFGDGTASGHGTVPGAEGGGWGAPGLADGEGGDGDDGSSATPRTWGEDDPESPGIDGGHIDVDTSSYLAEVEHGDTDGHVHEYDDKYDVTVVDAFAILDGGLHNIDEDLTDGDQPFKLIMSNTDLSPHVRLVINETYDAGDASTYTWVGDYSDKPLALLDTYSLDGAAGTRRLDALQLWIDPLAIYDDGIIGTVTGCVRGNERGAEDEWRNGALTIQAVATTDAGTVETDTAISNGGVHGVASDPDALLWELTIFWHWDGPCYGDDDWSTHVPTYED